MDDDVFSGEFHHTIDDKGRLILPSKFRARFSDGLWLTRAMDSCIEIWTDVGYATQIERAARLNIGKPEHRMVRRLLMSAHESQLDSQHRVTLPSTLRRTASLDRAVVVTGNLDRVEIWDLARWEAYMTQAGVRLPDFDGELDL